MAKRNYEDECGDHGGSGGDCGLPAGWGTDFNSGKCRHHRGTSPDGESHAGNQNAMKTGVHSDPVNLFDWLAENDAAGMAYILSKLHDHAEAAPKPVFVVDVTPETVDSFGDVEAALTAYGDDLLLMCIRDYTRWRASKQQVIEGVTTEQTRSGDHGPYTVVDENPVNLALDRQDKTTLRMKDKFGLLPDTGADVEVGITAEFWDDLTNHYDSA